MSYDFESLVDRRKMNSHKWAVKENEIPMWVADMDFKTAPEIMKALHHRIDQDGLGYTFAGQDYQNAIAQWQKNQHNYSVDESWVLFCPGVINAIRAILKVVSNEGDQVCLLTPIYHTFFRVIDICNRIAVESEMDYQEGVYSINYQDLELKLSNEKTKVFILCHPHNPTGQLWDKKTLLRISELCRKHDVLIISDEIHCDLVHPGSKFVPMGKIDSSVITCTAASKAFNLAGLKASAIIVKDSKLRGKISQQCQREGYSDPNVFACVATIAAYNHGADWLKSLNEYLSKNRMFLTQNLKQKCPLVQVVKAKATYLAWLDCSKVTNNSQELCDFIRQKTGLFLSCGNQFRGNGSSFIRWNYACPKWLLEEALDRFEQGIIAYQAEKGIRNGQD